jgi:NAD+ kinase
MPPEKHMPDQSLPSALPAPQRLIVFYHPRVEGAEALAALIADDLASRLGRAMLRAPLQDPEARARVREQDMLIVVGGDGSMLRSGHLAAPYGVPVLGVDAGRLGFLAEIQPDEWRPALERVLAGGYWLEERMMLHVEHRRNGNCLAAFEALNEAVVSRGAPARPVRLKTMIDGGVLTTYVADGLIIATPTGSTAYALAVGGPILPPELKNILLLAIAPHLSLDRAIVLAQGATVEVIVHTEHQAVLTADGHVEMPLQDGDHVFVRMSEYLTRYVRVRPASYFYKNLMARMAQNPSADKNK